MKIKNLTKIMLAIITVTAMLFTLSACGNGDPAAETTSTDTSAEAPPPSEYGVTEPHQTVEADISVEVYSLALTVGEISGIIHISRPLEKSVNQYLDTTMEIQHYDSEDYTTYEVEEIIIQGYYEGNEAIYVSLSLREEHAYHGIGGATAVMIDPQTLFFRISIPDEQSAGTFTLSANSSIRYDVTDVYRHSLVHSDNHQEIGDIMELEYNPQQLAISCDYIKIAESLHSPYAVELNMNNKGLSHDDLVELVRYFPHLQGLNLNRNHITDLSPLTGLANLKNLSLSGNYTLLTDYSREDVEIMLGQGFDIDIDDYIAFLSDLSPLAELHSLETLTLGGGGWLSVGGNPIDISALAGLTNLTSLNLQSNEISDITALAGLTNLESLNLSGNDISDLTPLAGLTSLETLNLDGGYGSDSGNVSDISPLAGLKSLTSLNLRNNAISDLSPLAELINLTQLELQGNEIIDLTPLARLVNLTSLDLNNFGGRDEGISDISPLANLVNLTELSIGGGQISDLSPLAGLTSLTSLSLWRNEISDLSPLSGLINLTELELGDGKPGRQLGNNIRNLTPLAELTNLTILELCNNEISDLSPLAELTNLTRLELCNNEISDLTPLAELTNLTNLQFENNKVSDLAPLSGLINLTHLSFRNRGTLGNNNDITDLTPLAGLINLSSLRLDRNEGITDWSPVDHVESVSGRP